MAVDVVLEDLLAFLRDSPTPYHAAASASARLEKAGFQRLFEKDSWAGLAAGRYFVVHGESALIAFIVPAAKAVGGFRIIGAHTDSPNLRLKPKAEYTKEGYAQLGVEVYGGALLNSWLDRDLSLAGRVLVRGEHGAISTRLLKIDRPLLRIPQLAIHLDREIDKGLSLNKQEHMVPVLGLAKEGGDLLSLCAAELGIEVGAVVSTELMLFDVVPPTLAGLHGELLFSARLDNLAMCHAAVSALAGAAALTSSRDDVIPLIALFDHEEVGSQSAMGAASAFLPSVLERIVLGLGKTRDDVHRALATSLCVSADMAHAVHPNYAEKHEPRHRPALNGGPVIKVNAQQRYATSALTAALFEALCKEAGVPVQHYAHRTDLPCGTTIGPITSTLLGIATVDVGNPMLSMHSVREMAGAKDPAMMTRVLTLFLGGSGTAL